MRHSRLIVACAVLTATQAFAASEPEYVANVQQAYTPSAQVKRVAIAPSSCPEDVDCEDLQKEIEKLLGKRTQLQIVTAEDTQKMMEHAGIDKIDFETRAILAEGMKVDAMVTLDVQQANVDLVEGEMTKIGQAEVQEGPVKIKHVKLALEMVGKDGTTFLQTSGEGKVQGFKGLNGVAKNTLETMIEQAVPKAE